MNHCPCRNTDNGTKNPMPPDRTNKERERDKMEARSNKSKRNRREKERMGSSRGRQRGRVKDLHDGSILAIQSRALLKPEKAAVSWMTMRHGKCLMNVSMKVYEWIKESQAPKAFQEGRKLEENVQNRHKVFEL
ncbi:hypothetical protein LR48_Vigan10g123100 [Vigna angularis]|uniref:Uncharacterized protein n=1 Tax=Phaseolus angularis TaxID=3914 RepID=A0A0L9VKS9_PHAAN|nr:hypothetical protein LR48_Vigan10g123100 [Vigna angularis]